MTNYVNYVYIRLIEYNILSVQTNQLTQYSFCKYSAGKQQYCFYFGRENYCYLLVYSCLFAFVDI